MKNEIITKELINEAMDYDTYNTLLIDLFEEGKTTGNDQSEAMLGYAKMNLQRMKRLNKTVQLTDELASLVSKNKREMIWLVLTEGWCGDAAQNIPIFNEIAKQNSNIELKLILRDENLDVMDEFLTNGGRSIPKLIALEKESLEIVGTWGPRPAPVQEMVTEFNKTDGDYSEFVKVVQLWYAKDKTLTMQSELIDRMKNWGIS